MNRSSYHAFALTAICVLGTNFLLLAFPQQVHADGLTTENLPPVLIRGKQLSLFIKINPPILTTQTLQDASLQLRLFDISNNQTIQHVTYFIDASKQDDPSTPLLSELFHSHSGPLTLNLEPKQGDVVVYGETDPASRAWTGVGDQLTVQGPLLLESGLYYFNIKILGMDNDTVSFELETAPVFQGWLSVGDSLDRRVVVDNHEYDITIISYYEKVQDYSFDSAQKRISWSTSFDWNLERISNQNIFVHQEIRIPRSLIQYLNSSSFLATVSDIPLTSFAVAVDPYTSPNEVIVHYLIDKPTIMQLAQIRDGVQSTASDLDEEMSFSLTINSGNVSSAQTSTELVSDNGAFKILLTWSPSQLLPDGESILKIRFYDAFAMKDGQGNLMRGDLRYELIFLDRIGNVILFRENLVAKNGTDSQMIRFPAEEVYDIQLTVTGIRESDSEEWDESLYGTGFGVVVVPEFSVPLLIVASSFGIFMAVARLKVIRSKLI